MKDNKKFSEEYLKDRACGALIGLAIGDSLGDAARKDDNRSSYGVTTDFNKGAAWSTDDTEFGLLTAQTLIECKGKLTTDIVVESWMQNVAVQDEFARGGASEKQAANNLKKGLVPPISGKFNTFHMSDGAAMRIAPVGIVCAGDPEKAAAMAKIDAEVSHYRDGIWGAQAVAAAISLAMVDSEWDEIFDCVKNYANEDSWFYYELQRTEEILKEHNYDILNSWMPLHDELKCTTWATTAEAIPAAIGCLKLEHSNFKKGLILASNYARDADTIGAVAGAILGAKYGLKSIPERWVEKTRYPSGTCLQFTKGKDILAMAEKLSDLIEL